MSKINETIDAIRQIEDRSESVSEIIESFGYEPASTGVELEVADLKALAESHERLLAACTTASIWLEGASIYDDLQQAIQEAEG